MCMLFNNIVTLLLVSTPGINSNRNNYVIMEGLFITSAIGKDSADACRGGEVQVYAKPYDLILERTLINITLI